MIADATTNTNGASVLPPARSLKGFEPADATVRRDAERATRRGMSLKRVAAALQVLLATRRAARSDDHGYWYAVARGM